jgi:hypothetical protein
MRSGLCGDSYELNALWFCGSFLYLGSYTFLCRGLFWISGEAYGPLLRKMNLNA